MTLEITIIQNQQGKWVATFEANVPYPAVANGNTPQAAMSALAPIINYENIQL